jgi:hypothetical protein
MTFVVFLVIVIVVLDYYYAGLLRVLMLGYPFDKATQGQVQFDQRVASVSSNLRVKRVFGLQNPFYSGQHCRVVIDDCQIFIGKAKYSSQLIVPLESIVNTAFSIKSVGYSSLMLTLVIDKNDYELKMRFFKGQESALRKIFE